MRKQLLTKMLLIAASLFVGTSAWAGTKKLYSQDFQSFAADANFTSVTGYWQYAAANVQKIVEGSGNKYLTYQTSTGSTRNAAINFNISSFSAGDNWTVSFDASLTPGNKDSGMFLAIVGANGSATAANAWSQSTGNLFSVTNTGASSTSYTVSVGAYTLEDALTLTSGSNYHYVLNWDGTNINLTITKDGEVTPALSTSKAYSSSDNTTYGNPKAIYWITTRYQGTTNIDNILVTEDLDEEVVSDPTIAITAVSGANRSVAITGGTSTDGTATVTTYYTTDGSDPTSSSSVYSSSLTITENCTVKAISISDKGGESNISSLAVTTGAITLNAPTFTKTAYSAGVSTITLSCDQSDKTLSPTATIHWSAGARSGDVASGTSVNVNDGETLEAYCVADGYTNSSTLSVTATPYVGATVWTESYTGTDGGKITLGDEIETGLYKMLASEGTITVSEYLLTANSNINNYFLLRNSTAPGIYSGNGRTYAITGLTAGQHVVVTTNNGSETATVTAGANLMKDTWETWPAHFAFDVTADGTAKFAINRYCSVASVTVYSSTVSATLGTNGYATFASTYPLDLTTANLPEGVKAYKASVSGKTVTFTALDQTVPANTGILLEGTPSASVNIPVVASGTAVAGNAFEVNTTGTTFSGDGDYYYFGLVKNTLTFRKFTPSSVAIPASKAYLKVLKSSVDAGARELNVVFEDEATGISAIPMNSEVMNNNYFDLQGRRVAQPTKGLYIVNGKKIIIK